MTNPGGEYYLGRAWGEVTLETDERGIRRAEGSMDGLDRSARRTAEGFEKAEDSVTKFERTSRTAIGTTNQAAKAHDDLNKKTREAIEAVDKRVASEKELKDLLKQEVRDEDAIEKAINKANRARLEAARISRERRTMERDLQRIIRETNSELGGRGDSTVTKTIKVNVDGESARRELRRIRNDVQDTVNATGKIAGGASRIAAGGGKAMLGGAAAGGAGLLGAGAIGGGVNAIVSLIGAVSELSGLFGTLPGIIGASVAVMGTLSVATAGFGEALKGLGEADFEKGLKDLSQNARDAAWTLNALWPMIKAGRESIQDNFFKGFSDQLLRLSTTVFPPVLAMMQELASIMNSTIIEVLDRLQTPEGLADLSSILGNIVAGFDRLSDSALPFFDAFMDIMTVSSSFLPQIADRINAVANEFAGWIDEMRASGELSSWIQTGIDSFSDLLTAVFNFSRGFAEIFKIANENGGGFLSILRDVSTQFLAWTKSTDGQNNLADFFSSVSEAARALGPILTIIANMLVGDLFPALANLGKAMAPQINLFFQNLAAAMTYLRPVIESLAGPLGQFTQALGETLARAIITLAPYLPIVAQAFADLMTSLGPQIPGIVRALADSFIALLPAIPMIIENLAMLATNILPLLPDLISSIVAIVPTLIQAFNLAVDALLGIGNAIRTVIGWGGQFLTFMSNLMVEWPGQAGDALNAWFTGPFMQFIGAIPEKLREMVTTIGEVLSDLWAKGFDAGKNLVLGIGQGIREWIGEAANSVRDLGNSVVNSLKDLLGIESPSKVFKQLGEYTMEGLAQGIASGAGMATGAMSTATGQVSKAGESGVEQFVKDATQMVRFSNMLVSFAKSVGDIVFDIAKLVTTDMKTGKSTLSGGWKRTVSDADLAQQKADRDYREGLKNTGGVEPGTYGPSDATKRALDAAGLGTPTGGTGTPGTNIKPGDKTVPLKQNPDGTWTSTDPAWAALIKRESGGIVDRMQEITDSNGGPGSPNAAQGLFQITPDTWRRAGGDRFAPNPAAATAEQQALIAAQIFGNNPKLGGDWGAGLPGRENPIALQEGLIAALAPGKNHGLLDNPLLNEPASGNRQVNASEFGGIDLQDNVAQTEGDRQRARRGRQQFVPTPYGLAPGTDTGGYGTGTSEVFPPWVMAMADAFGIKASTYSGHQESDRDEHGYADNPQGLNRGIDWSAPMTPEGIAKMQKFADYLATIPGALEQVIWENPNTGKRVGVAGGEMNAGYFDDSTYADHQNHVHTRQSFSLPLPGQYYPGATVPPEILAAANRPAPGGDHGLLNDPLVTAPVPVSLDETSLDRIGTEYRAADENRITDEQLQGFLGDNPDLQAAIETGLNANSSDAEVSNTLNSLQRSIDEQTKINTPQSRYLADQLGQQQNKIATERGFSQGANPLDTASDMAGGTFSVVQDVLGAVSAGIESIGAAKDITGTLVRGISNTEDIMKTIDSVQVFVNFAAKIATAVSSGLGLASSLVGAGAGGDPSGGAAGASMALGAASSIAGIVSSTLQTINAAIDLGQEAYRIVSKHIGKMLSNIVGAGQGSLMGDVKFLLDKNDWTLKAWSEDNPEDKRSLNVPRWMRDDVAPIGSKMRDLNLYVGPGTDPNEAMNHGMWMVQTNQGGVFSSDY